MIADLPLPNSFEKKKKKKETKNVTHDMWHVTYDTWHMTSDKLHLTGVGRWTFSKNFSFEDIFTKDEWLTWSINQWVMEMFVDKFQKNPTIINSRDENKKNKEKKNNIKM